MTHWHDTPEFDRVLAGRVEGYRSKPTDQASHICWHGGTEFFMPALGTHGYAWFLCRECCMENSALELLCLAEPPGRAA